MMISSLGQGFRKYARTWLTMAFCLVTFVAGQASMNAHDDKSGSLTASQVFAEAPLEVLDMLRPSTRLDMLDYYSQADSILPATNALGGESRLVKVAPDYLKVAITPISTLEIKVLRQGKKDIVMTLYTTGSEEMARDTEIRFFDSKMNPLDAKKFIKAPVLYDFFTLKGSMISDDDLREKVPYTAVEYTTGPGSQPLSATLTTLRVISKDDSDLLTSIFTPTLTAQWNGKFDFK